MIRKRPSRNPGMMLVTFEMPAQVWAERITLVGDFNGWDKDATPLEQDRDDGAWRVVMELETGREYQFRYLADGQHWHNDSSADRHEDNPHGSTNSVIVL